MAAASDGDWSASISTPSFRLQWDVFLSFRGEDTRYGFTSRLHAELVRNGVRTFIDDEGLDRGDEIAPSLLAAIEDSAASIAIISKRYASSWWCLEELAKIVDCRKLILPVFYEVDPSDVRRQKGPFEDDLRLQELRFGVEKVLRWRKAMEKTGGIAGWDSRIREESKLIQSLVQKILAKLRNIPLGVAKHPVGLESRLEELINLVDVKANGVRVLVFHGMGGVGKTTLAKALYNKLLVHFKRRSFISNVGKISQQHNGLIALQSKLIEDLSGSAQTTANEISSGILSIKAVVSEEPVLLVLDDVDDINQINVVAARREWFYDGSRVIITTRNNQILQEDLVAEFYEVKELNFPQSLELFSYHAFGRGKPSKDFVSFSEQVVSLTGGLPLALEVFGSSLFDKRRIEEWEDALNKLRRIRPGCLQDVLEISFNKLDDEEKCIFLDIACFFVDMKMKREDTIDIFKGCGFNAEVAITDFVGKSLIKIIDDNILWMHDQLRDMGRQIVQRERDPGRRSRLWDHDEIISVLKRKKGTRSIEGIILSLEKGKTLPRLTGLASRFACLREIYEKYFGVRSEVANDDVVSTKAFEPMVNLRLLQINHLRLKGSVKQVFAELKWLRWKGCPLKALPSDFCVHGLAVLDLSESKIEQVWNHERKNKVAKKLQVLDLHNCTCLIDVPNLSGLPLEKLILQRCTKLAKVHDSLGDLTTLTHLNLEGCLNLVEFPNDVSGLKKLEYLNLSGCIKLNALPEDMSGLQSLKDLLVDRTAITMLPDSIFRLKKIERFSLNDCLLLKQLPYTIGKLSSLTDLSLDGSAFKEMPSSIGNLTNLEKLSLRRCRSLTSLPDSMGNLKSLIELFLDHSLIKELPASTGSLSHLKTFSVGYCRALSSLPDSMDRLGSLMWLTLEKTLITEVPQLVTLNALEKLDLGYCEKLRSLPESIGNLLNLTHLYLQNTIITELPQSIGLLERLVILKLDCCKYLRRLPTSIGKLKNLHYLMMMETTLRELPEEIGMLSSLKILKMEELDAHSCKLCGKIPDDFKRLKSLETFNLGWNDICSLPSSLTDLSVLKKLLLPHCKQLKFLPLLPSSLIDLNAANCTGLESLPDMSSLKNLQELQITNCRKVIDIPGLQCLKSLRRLYTSGCNACLPALKSRLAKVTLKHIRYLSVPGNQIPHWFVPEVPSLPSRRNRQLRGVIIGVVVALDQHAQDNFRNKLPAIVDVQAKIIRQNDPIHTTTLYLMGVPDTDEDQLYLCRFQEYNPFVRMLQEGDQIKVAMRDRPYFSGLELKKYGMYLIFEHEDDMDCDDDELFDESQQSVTHKLAKFFSPL
ncbi:hypothetical protein NMG60_11032252 [Bertholletia excelsa]